MFADETEKQRTELLSPAGSLDICRAVIAAGADAVYLGGVRFGARAYANNFSREELIAALDFAHLRGKKIYLTVNTLLKNRELEGQLYDELLPLYEQGLDAVIVQDFGVAAFLHRNFPDLPLHASTQMSVTSAAGAEILQQNGFRRIVTARELSLEEIRDIFEKTGIEIESFVHGALCYCYSGQCLFSSILGGRSGNRGRCAQPCRLPYEVVDADGRHYNKKEELYPISPKDLNALHLLPEMVQAGVYSFKIEGRMKQLPYAAGVTAVYRKYLDLIESGEDFVVDEADKKRLFDLGNRNGFTEGYYRSRNDRSVLSLTASAHRGASNEVENRKNRDPAPAEREIDAGKFASSMKIPVTARAVIRTGEHASLTLRCGETEVFVRSASRVDPAKSRPLSFDETERQLKQTGGTEFKIRTIDLTLSGDAFLPVRTLKELRRDGTEKLKGKLLEAYRRSTPETKRYSAASYSVNKKKRVQTSCRGEESIPETSVLVSSSEQLHELLGKPWVKKIYIRKVDPEFVRRIHAAGKEAWFAFPFIFRTDAQGRFLKRKRHFLSCGFDGLLVRSYDSLMAAVTQFPNLPVTADQSLYTYSNEASAAFVENGCSRVTVPYEVNEKELHHRVNQNSELIVYGWIPLMHSAECLYKNFAGCQKTDPKLYLSDRYRNRFFVAPDCENCYNTIYNSKPLCLFSSAGKVLDLDFASLRLEFLTETKKETSGILTGYEAAFGNPAAAGKAGSTGMPVWQPAFDYTNGHFKRGVE